MKKTYLVRIDLLNTPSRNQSVTITFLFDRYKCFFIFEMTFVKGFVMFKKFSSQGSLQTQ